MVRPLLSTLALLALSLAPIIPSAASTFNTLYSVHRNTDGFQPESALISIDGILYGTTAQGGAAPPACADGCGTVFRLDPATGAETVLHSFAGGATDGAFPEFALTKLGDMLYGTTRNGGTASNGTVNGTVFSINPRTGAETVIHNFAGGNDGASPAAALISVGGMLYGITKKGGPANEGTVFSVDPATGVETVLHSFIGGNEDGMWPQTALASAGGLLYGTATSGVTGGIIIFSINPATGAETVVAALSDQEYSSSALINVGGILYGTTLGGGSSGNGTVFSLNPATGVKTLVYSFNGSNGTNPDGALPEAALLNVGGTLYGTTRQGGTSGLGTVFSLNPVTGAESVLYSFDQLSAGYFPTTALTNVDGVLYGTTTTADNVFSVNLATGAEATVYTFTGVFSPGNNVNYLTSLNGKLVLSTSSGGAADAGEIAKIQPTRAAARVLYDFSKVGSGHGYDPESALTNVGGTLYGTTQQGGAFGDSLQSYGTVFSINPATGAQATIYSFPENQTSLSALIGVKGILYGTTEYTGAAGFGTVYSVNPATGAEAVVHSFAGGSDGAFPQARLISVGGTLYGTTSEGGTANDGTVFSLNPATGAEAVVYSFVGGSNGANPRAGLINVNGTLYGTTSGGGSAGDGTVFSLNPATGVETALYSFSGRNDGYGPSTLISFGGMLYGTTASGGDSHSIGTVFSVNPATGVETVLYRFQDQTLASDGQSPSGALVQIGNALYGTTSQGGGFGLGTVFQLIP